MGKLTHFCFFLARNQRVVVEFDGVHGRAVHRHLSPDEGPERLHRQTGQKDRGRRLGFRFLLLVALAGPHRHRAHPLQRISNGRALRHETLPSRVSGIYQIVLLLKLTMAVVSIFVFFFLPRAISSPTLWCFIWCHFSFRASSTV